MKTNQNATVVKNGSSGIISRYLEILTEERLVESIRTIKSKKYYLTRKKVLVKSILS